jgi:alkanesulfonate monooxygenase SsuD/methylene tetrahydromethanopterin reductase-like flavin-dependent oxidoreductase (luciferase family)
VATLLHLGVALEGTGWHPASWRDPDARPAELLTAPYWSDLVQEAERGLLDFVSIEDGLHLQSEDPAHPDGRTDRVRGRLDAVLIAARVAPTTRHIGFLPTAVVTHTEPFHLSKAIATLDYVSTGRAGIRVQVSTRRDDAAHLGRRRPPQATEVIDEAADYIEVLRRLWDSWEDDAEIRDAATGRFIDRDKLHYIDVAGRWFSVRGPSITPRPPQGQPVVAALGHGSPGYRLIAQCADIGLVTPRDAPHAADIVGEIRGTDGGAHTVHVFGDLVVFLDGTPQAAADRRHRLNETAGEPYESDARIFAGTPGQLADLLLQWRAAGLTGFRLRPAAIPHDLIQITRGLVPELQRRDAFRTGYEAGTFRGLLGLPRPANRYVSV